METSLSWRSYFELLRFPAVFTAIADVMMGFLVTFGAVIRAPPFVMLAAASALLYLSGMVLNDVFDADVDAMERPHRPIPSQRVSLVRAKVLGWGLACVGPPHCGPPRLSRQLDANHDRGGRARRCIVAYDGGLKRTLRWVRW